MKTSAETFAIWAFHDSGNNGANNNRGWKSAGTRLEYLHLLLEHAKTNPPKVTTRAAAYFRRYPGQAEKKQLARYYTVGRRKLYAEDFPDFLRMPTCALFLETPSPGSELVAAGDERKNRRATWLPPSFVGPAQRKYTVDMLVRKLIERCRQTAAHHARPDHDPRVLRTGPLTWAAAGHQSSSYRPL